MQSLRNFKINLLKSIYNIDFNIEILVISTFKVYFVFKFSPFLGDL